jgi:protein arginine kinase
MDDLIEESIDYAYDKDYGYLTSCPTNTGTGMRASYMLHLSALESAGRLRKLFTAMAKLGMTARGTYGEGSEPFGGIYQISNQTTIGKTEDEIIAAIKSVTAKLIEQENDAMDGLLSNNSPLYDKIHRSYGLLKYARRIGSREAVSCLSDVRLGLISGRLQVERPKKTIYNIMIDIQPGGVSERAGHELDGGERDIARADYIRNILREE